MPYRADRLNNQIQRELAEIIAFKVKDPRITGMPTVTRVEVNRDYTLAMVYLSVNGSEQEQRQTVEALNSGKGFIKSLLGKAVRIRTQPDLRFVLDRSLENVQRVEEILYRLKNDDAPTES